MREGGEVYEGSATLLVVEGLSPATEYKYVETRRKEI
jgi:hypothetical protein